MVGRRHRKSMLAARFLSILSPLSEEEVLQVAVHSVSAHIAEVIQYRRFDASF